MSVNYVHLPHSPQESATPDPFDLACAQAARRFHSSIPEYASTPLVNLPSLAAKTGVASIHVKDESYRFGLDAFKVLGGSYSIARKLGELLDIPVEDLSYELLTSREIHNKTGMLTFVTATDGNHGRGVAWTASRLGHQSVVYMPKGSAQERLENMVQDTAWEGYEDIPRWIMEGYLTLSLEAWEQLNGITPTHLFLQAGVGAFAGSAAGFFSCVPGTKPVITIVEPDKADCLYRTARANDGKLHPVTGDMDSMMAGLCCGEPCTIGWEVLRRRADYFVSMSDDVAALGMRILGNPLGSDPKIISGESGAASMGFVTALLTDKKLENLKNAMGINEHSHILCVSTEGATDRENYQKILAKGPVEL